jgi:hypothetical protein
MVPFGESLNRHSVFIFSSRHGWPDKSLKMIIFVCLPRSRRNSRSVVAALPTTQDESFADLVWRLVVGRLPSQQ